MRPLIITGDIVAVGAMVGAAFQLLPSLAGLLAVIWYGFVIYDRIKYGPDVDGRLHRERKAEKDAQRNNE